MVFSSPVHSANNTGSGNGNSDATGKGGFSQAEIEKMDKAIKAGNTVTLKEGGNWTVSGTGTGDYEAILAKFENMPGGKTATMLGRKIITMYREYLDKIEAFAKSIGL